MNGSTGILLHKMNKVIESSSDKHKLIAMRYLSLANRRLQKVIKDGVINHSTPWDIIGASIELNQKWDKKFGAFIPLSEAVRNDNP